MKHIMKHQEPKELIAWKKEMGSHASYKCLQKPEKDITKQSLLREQGYICCYCECTIDEKNSHIEHFSPQRSGSVDELEYQNFLCSCNGANARSHCGHKKAGWFDKNLLISPLDPACEDFFTYLSDGYIKPKKDNDPLAQTTIDKLGLNFSELKDKRKKLIDGILALDAVEPLSEEDFLLWKNKIKQEFLEEKGGKYEQFWTLIKCFSQ